MIPTSAPPPRRLFLARRAVIAAALAGALLVAGPAPAKAPAARTGCAGSEVVPRPAGLAKVRKATLCLLNRERRARGLAPLRFNPKLQRSADLHSRDMVARKYFAHRSLSGTDIEDRVRSTGYMRSARSWVVGENLAWGTARLAGPAAIVRGWMQSPGHRANILDGRYREIGIGIVLGVPNGASGGATYTTNFGYHRLTR